MTDEPITDSAESTAAEPWLDFFPFDTPNENQRDAMPKMYQAIANGQPILLEGACGTGKTLTALAPALAWGTANGKRVIIATSVKAQTEQFIVEARDIKAKHNINVTVLYGKGSLCPNMRPFDNRRCKALCGNTYKKVRDTNATIEDFEDDNSEASIKGDDKPVNVGDDEVCPYLMNVLIDQKEELLNFAMWFHNGVRHPKEAFMKASEHKMCPYESIKRNLFDADLVVCNYEHMLNPSIREVVLRWMGGGKKDDALGLEDVIIIFDEAHNLEDKARNHSMRLLTSEYIERAMEEMEATINNTPLVDGAIRNYAGQHTPSTIKSDVAELLNAVKSYADRYVEVFKAKNKGKRIEFDEHVEWPILMKLPEYLREVSNSPQDKAASMSELGDMVKLYKFNFTGNKNSRSYIGIVGTFLQEAFAKEQDVKYELLPYVERMDEAGHPGMRLELFCCIPTDVTEEMMENAHSIVTMSATLQPFDAICDSLGIKKPAVRLEYGTPFPENRRLTIATGTHDITSAKREDPKVIQETSKLIDDIVEGTPGNVMVVFPTGREAKKYHELYRPKPGVQKYIDVSSNTDSVKSEFFDRGTEHAGKGVLFTYMWGKLTEGVDFKNDRLRTVVIVGVPYRMMDAKNNAVKAAYDNLYGGKGFDYAAFTPMVRRVRQTKGRVVRNMIDYGACVFIDKRYGMHMMRRGFPECEKKEILDVKPEVIRGELEKFFAGIKGV